jgi:hypothetical protein
MDGQPAAPRPTLRRRLARRLRKRGWGRDLGGVRRRILELVDSHDPWWDWGGRLMILVGDDDGGNWSEPQHPTWWYRFGTATRMWRTGYPRHPLSTLQVVTDYDEFRRIYDPLNEDQRYEWKAIAVDQDGDLILGHQYWGKPFYGLNRWEVPLLRRYLRKARRHDWYGLRSWLFGQALHAAVHSKKPFTCQQVPPRNSSGYSHWYCRLPRRHDGLHRYVNYTWGELDGESMDVTHVPELH